MTNPRDEEEPLIRRKWAGPLAALFGVFASIATWVASQVVNLDTRIDALEAARGHLIDPSTGEIRPSTEARAAMSRLESVTDQVNRMWGRLHDLEDKIWQLKEPPP